MKLLNEDNDILLLSATKAENALLRDVLKVSLEFDYALWGELEEEDVRALLAQAEKRLDKEDFTITREEFRGLYGIMAAAAHAVFIEDYGLEASPVEALMQGFGSIMKELIIRRGLTPL